MRSPRPALLVQCVSLVLWLCTESIFGGPLAGFITAPYDELVSRRISLERTDERVDGPISGHHVASETVDELDGGMIGCGNVGCL